MFTYITSAILSKIGLETVIHDFCWVLGLFHHFDSSQLQRAVNHSCLQSAAVWTKQTLLEHCPTSGTVSRTSEDLLSRAYTNLCFLCVPPAVPFFTPWVPLWSILVSLDHLLGTVSYNIILEQPPNISAALRSILQLSLSSHVSHLVTVVRSITLESLDQHSVLWKNEETNKTTNHRNQSHHISSPAASSSAPSIHLFYINTFSQLLGLSCLR